MIKEFEKRVLSSLILIPIAFFFIIKGSVFFLFFLSMLFLITSYEWFKMSKKNNLIMFLGIIFLLFSFYTAYLLRLEKGIVFFLFVILISVLTDVGGFFFGKTFKGPKLTKISPNKTYAGVFGSFIFSFVGGLIFIEYSSHINFSMLSFFKGFEKIGINYDLSIFIIIFSISTISQVGDLTISYFKRKAKIKDTGKLLPGHGGFLDRMDGIIYSVPFAYLIFTINYY